MNEKVLLCKLIGKRREVENLDVLDSNMVANFLESSLCVVERRAETCCVYISTFDSGKFPRQVHILCDVQVNTYIQILEPFVVELQSPTSLTISK